MGINRGTVLDLINDVHRASGFKDYNSYSYLFDQVDTMPESVEKPEPHWIPVTIEPQEDDDYFVTLEDSNGNFTDVVSYDSVQGWGFFPDDGDDFLPLANVIAWMPLPEPYKGVTT